MYGPDDYDNPNVQNAPQISGIKKKKSSGGFQSMGFSWQILKAILNNGYKVPTPIQRKAIPEILLGKDVVAMARTGSGKTAAFLLPMFQRLMDKENKLVRGSSSGPRALIMSPTRELALQTFKFTKQFGKFTDIKAAVILGGDKIEDQFEIMHENPDIIIATPGRFLHICIEMNYKLNSIEYVCFDEADRLFEMGFKEQLNEILNKLPVENRQTLLFSATLPASLVEFARAGLQNPILIRLDVESKLSDKLRMAFFQCRNDDKLSILIYLLTNVIKAVKKPEKLHPSERKLEQTLIFVATKHHVEFLKDLLEELDYSVSYCYSSLDQTARQINIGKFQMRKTSVMIVTDVAARGIDIPMLDYVINFNFPAKAKLFIHRVGRVARAGNYGNSYSFVTNDELPYMHELYEFLTKQIRFAKDDMDPKDWNEVYGSVPQDLINIEKDAIKSMIESKIELAGAFQTQENAYKQYLKSRPLASTQSVRAAKNIRLVHSALPIHPIFKLNSDLKSSIQAEATILEKLRNYTTKSTIFEINKTPASHQTALVMRKKREHHDKVVEKFKSKEFLEENVSLFQKNIYSIQNMFKNDDEKNYEEEEEQGEEDNEGSGDEDATVRTFDDEDLVIKITNNKNSADENSSEKKTGQAKKKGRKSNGGVSKKVEKRKNRQIIDTEHFIPYKPKNFNQEKALGINTNFNREVTDATLDLVGDDNQQTQRNLQKMKWDRKKKKFVSMQSTLDKAKRIKTESGSYIKASYKSDLYSKWLKKSKTGDRDNQGDENNGDDDGDNKQQSFKNKKYFGSSLSENKYFGSSKGKFGAKKGGREDSGGGFRGGKFGASRGGRDDNGGGFRGGKFGASRGGREDNDGGGFGGKRKSFSNGSDSRSSGAKRFKRSDDSGPSGGGNKKRFNTGLKSKDQIIKERNRKRKVQEFQANRKKGGSKENGGGGRGWKPYHKR